MYKYITFRGAVYRHAITDIDSLTVYHNRDPRTGVKEAYLATPFTYGYKPLYDRSLAKTHVVEVPLSSLRALQHFVKKEWVRKYMDPEFNGGRPGLPTVVYDREVGLNYIDDGHHRLTAALLRGDKTALVNQIVPAA